MWPGAIELTVWQSPAMLGALDDDPAIEDPLCDGRLGEVAGSELVAGRERHCLAWGRVEGHEEEKKRNKREKVEGLERQLLQPTSRSRVLDAVHSRVVAISGDGGVTRYTEIT